MEKTIKLGDLYSMKVQPNSLGITEVFEIRLDVKIWKRIKLLAEFYQVSFSWIVRLCVVEVLEKQDVDSIIWTESSNNVKQKYRNPLMKLHRHMLCLYGEDGFMLRIVSARRSMTISQLVRVTLELHLDKLENREPISKLALVQDGVKCRRQVEVATTIRSDAFFHIKRLKFFPFFKTDYRRFMPFRHDRLINCFSG